MGTLTGLSASVAVFSKHAPDCDPRMLVRFRETIGYSDLHLVDGRHTRSKCACKPLSPSLDPDHLEFTDLSAGDCSFERNRKGIIYRQVFYDLRRVFLPFATTE